MEEAKPLDEAAEFQKPLKDLLPQEKRSEYQALLDRWGELDIEGGRFVEDPNNPRAWQIASEQQELRRRMNAITSELPGGKVYDVVQVGTGATGLTVGQHGGVENLKTLVLEHSTGKGTASGKTGRYANVQGAASPLGQSGPQRALVGKLQGMRMGTEYRTISEIESATRDPETELLRCTKGLGWWSRQRVLQARCHLRHGSRPGAPFELRDTPGRPLPNRPE